MTRSLRTTVVLVTLVFCIFAFVLGPWVRKVEDQRRRWASSYAHFLIQAVAHSNQYALIKNEPLLASLFGVEEEEGVKEAWVSTRMGKIVVPSRLFQEELPHFSHYQDLANQADPSFRGKIWEFAQSIRNEWGEEVGLAYLKIDPASFLKSAGPGFGHSVFAALLILGMALAAWRLLEKRAEKMAPQAVQNGEKEDFQWLGLFANGTEEKLHVVDAHGKILSGKGHLLDLNLKEETKQEILEDLEKESLPSWQNKKGERRFLVRLASLVLFVIALTTRAQATEISPLNVPPAASQVANYLYRIALNQAYTQKLTRALNNLEQSVELDPQFEAAKFRRDLLQRLWQKEVNQADHYGRVSFQALRFRDAIHYWELALARLGAMDSKRAERIGRDIEVARQRLEF